MQTHHRQRLKAVQSIHDQLTAAQDRLNLPVLPEPLWQLVQLAARSIAKAQIRGWRHASHRQSQLLVTLLQDLQCSLNDQISQLRDRLLPRNVATIAEFYRDLLALEQEFPCVEIDIESQELRVTTEPVLLEDVDLGRFLICLNWRRPQATHSYRVVALDPNPAASNEDVTHPHVNDEQVCEGDGHLPIARALAEGRLFDFFVMVDRLLHTYASGRAYVELSSWSGTACHDCGSIMDEDDNFNCSRCEEAVCGDCGTVCSVCEQFYCNGCSSSCQRCDSATCTSCLEECRSCRQRVCPECLNQDLCEQCYEEQIESEESIEECVPPEAADAPVQPDSVGQTITSA